MKRIIKCSESSSKFGELKQCIDELLGSKIGKKIYGKFMLSNNRDGWIEGVKDTLELVGEDVPGFNRFLELVYSYGSDAVSHMCNRLSEKDDALESVNSNTVTNSLPERLDNRLQDFAQMTGFISYTDILDFSKVCDDQDIKTLNKLFRKLDAICNELGMDYYEAYTEDDDAKVLVPSIAHIISGK